MYMYIFYMYIYWRSYPCRRCHCFMVVYYMNTCMYIYVSACTPYSGKPCTQPTSIKLAPPPKTRAFYLRNYPRRTWRVFLRGRSWLTSYFLITQIIFEFRNNMFVVLYFSYFYVYFWYTMRTEIVYNILYKKFLHFHSATQLGVASTYLWRRWVNIVQICYACVK